MAFILTIAAGVAVSVLTAGWMWRRFGRAARAAQRAGTTLRRLAKLQLLAFRRTRAVSRARAEGVNVVTSVRGNNPAVVSYDGAHEGKLYAYRDPRRLASDVRGGRVHHLATACCGRPPRVGARIRP